MGSIVLVCCLLALSCLTDAVHPLHMSGRTRLRPPRRFMLIKTIFNNSLMDLAFLCLPPLKPHLVMIEGFLCHSQLGNATVARSPYQNCCVISPGFSGVLAMTLMEGDGWFQYAEVCFPLAHIYRDVCPHRTTRQTVTVCDSQTACCFGCMPKLGSK